MSYIYDPITNTFIDDNPKENNLGKNLRLQPLLDLSNSPKVNGSAGKVSTKSSPALSKTDIVGNIEKLSEIYDDPGPIKNGKLNPKQYKQMMQHLVRKKNK
tara:strand:+ start:648 stop:950 length:303 start_codon:yes stop_codon:yes gene_type:complete